MSDTKPNLSWRGVLRSAMPRAPKDDREFQDYCAATYADEKRTLEATLVRSAPEREISGARLGVYLIALALLTYGRLDVIDDIVENMPPLPHPARRGLAPALHQLIPAPAGSSPHALLAWVHANAAQLRWDEDAGRFVLEKP